MTDETRQFVLDLHNKLRNKVASGNETRNEQPPATNMNILVSWLFYVNIFRNYEINKIDVSFIIKYK